MTDVTNCRNILLSLESPKLKGFCWKMIKYFRDKKSFWASLALGNGQLKPELPDIFIWLTSRCSITHFIASRPSHHWLMLTLYNLDPPPRPKTNHSSLPLQSCVYKTNKGHFKQSLSTKYEGLLCWKSMTLWLSSKVWNSNFSHFHGTFVWSV